MTQKRTKNLNSAILYDNSNIYQSIEKINQSKYFGFLVILNKHKKLIGTISDGDIRRALLKRVNFSLNIKSIMCKKPLSLKKKDYNMPKAKKILKDNNIKYLPILSDDNKLISIISFNDFFFENEKKISQDISIVIMAGGLGKRLRPITNNKPKPLVKVNNISLIEHVIEQVKQKGFQNAKIFIIVNYLKDQIITHVKKTFRNLKITFVEERKMLGTAGGLWLIKNKLNKDFFLINADIFGILPLDTMLDFHVKYKNTITVGTIQHKVQIPYGVLLKKKNNFLINEKPNYYFDVNAGIYMINKKVFSLSEKKRKIDMNEVINLANKKKLKISPFHFYENWIDIGDKEKLNYANTNFEKFKI